MILVISETSPMVTGEPVNTRNTSRKKQLGPVSPPNSRPDPSLLPSRLAGSYMAHGVVHQPRAAANRSCLMCLICTFTAHTFACRASASARPRSAPETVQRPPLRTALRCDLPRGSCGVRCTAFTISGCDCGAATPTSLQPPPPPPLDVSVHLDALYFSDVFSVRYRPPVCNG